MKKLVLISLFLCCLVSLGLSETEPCSLSNGRRGTCIHIKHCPYALVLIPQRLKPDICRFEGYYPIVCCPSDNNPGEEPPEDTKPELESFEDPDVLEDDIFEESMYYYSELDVIEDEIYGCNEIKNRYQYNNFAPDVGSVSARSLEYLFMAALGYGLVDDIKWHCSGALISARHVLTAAHCLETSKSEPIRWVRLGDLDLETEYNKNEQQDFQIVNRIRHPDYKPPQKYNDIAIIELDRKILHTIFVAPACLHAEDTLPPTTTLYATGWRMGVGDLFEEDSDYLQEFRLALTSRNECHNEYIANPADFQYGITDKHVCAAGNRFRTDKFDGNCGGPLSYQNIDAKGGYRGYTIYAVSSFGKIDGFVRDPTVYTKVSSYVPWIQSVIRPHS